MVCPLRHILLRIIVLTCIVASSSVSQHLLLDVRDLTIDSPPHIAFRAKCTYDGRTIHPDSVLLTITDNGRPVDFLMNCPEGYSYKSIGLVLDNSGSMILMKALDTLKVAASEFIDSLDDTDECCVATFDEGGSVTVPFTSDKESLKNYINKLRANGGTPLFKTVLLAIQELAAAGGRKSCIVMTDGEVEDYIDMTSEIVAYAVENDIIIHTISWITQHLVDVSLQTMAIATGGKYYYLSKSDKRTLGSVYKQILGEMESDYCSIVYNAWDCDSSVKNIRWTATYKGETVTVDTSIFWPLNYEPLHYSLDADNAELIPPDDVNFYLRLDAPVYGNVPYSYSFLLKFDTRVLRIQYPFIVDSTAIPYRIDARIIRPGVWKCDVHSKKLQTGSNILVGFSFNVHSGNTSGRTVVTDDSRKFKNSCNSSFMAQSDTITICRCESAFQIRLPSPPPVASKQIRLPVILEDTAAVTPMTFLSSIRFDPDYFEPIGVDGIGAITENAALAWSIKNRDTLEVCVDESFVPGQGNVLYFVRFNVHPRFVPESAFLTLASATLFSDCCYNLSIPDTGSVLVDGLCDKVVRRRADFTLEQTHPNPMRGSTQFRFTVDEHAGTAAREASLILYSSNGDELARLYSGTVHAGAYSIPYANPGLPSGTYYYVLTIDGRAQTRSMLVVR